jgi:suppressor of G2 allele of SKP1
MSNTDATLSQAALAKSDYPLAIQHLTRALSSQSNPSPLWLIQRSTAYQRTGQHALALADADNAVLAAHARGKRELIATGHFRRAVALHGLGRYGNARMCLIWCQKFNEKEKGVTIWMAKVKGDYEQAGGDGAECNKVEVKEMPDRVEEVKQEGEEKPVEVKKGKGKVVEKVEEKTNAPATVLQTPKEKIRNEWYQSNTTVTIEIFAKGVPKDAEVNIEEGSVSFSTSFSLPSLPRDCIIWGLLTRCSSRLASPLQHRIPHTTIPSALSSQRSTSRDQAFELPHTRLRSFFTSRCQV